MRKPHLYRLPAAKAGELLGLLDKNLRRGKLDSISENDGESVISYRFTRLDREALLALKQKVSAVADRASVNLFFHSGSP